MGNFRTREPDAWVGNTKTADMRCIDAVSGWLPQVFPTTDMMSKKNVMWFPKIRGKTIKDVELWSTAEGTSVDINFDDRTLLNFELISSISVAPELSAGGVGSTSQ